MNSYKDATLIRHFCNAVCNQGFEAKVERSRPKVSGASPAKSYYAPPRVKWRLPSPASHLTGWVVNPTSASSVGPSAASSSGLSRSAEGLMSDAQTMADAEIARGVQRLLDQDGGAEETARVLKLLDDAAIARVRGHMIREGAQPITAILREVAEQVETGGSVADGFRRRLEKAGIDSQDEDENVIANQLVAERYFGIAVERAATEAAERLLPGLNAMRRAAEEDEPFDCADCSARFNTRRDFACDTDWQTQKFVVAGETLCLNCYEARREMEVEPPAGGAASCGEGDCASDGPDEGEGDEPEEGDEGDVEMQDEWKTKRARTGASPAELMVASEVLGLSSKTVPAPVERKPEDALHGRTPWISIFQNNFERVMPGVMAMESLTKLGCPTKEEMESADLTARKLPDPTAGLPVGDGAERVPRPPEFDQGVNDYVEAFIKLAGKLEALRRPLLREV